MKIIAFSGKKQSGKTTAVASIIRKIAFSNRWKDIGFADQLKYIVQTCFGASDRNLYGSEKEKNKLLSCGKSAREVLQIVGTDWLRSLDPNCWVNAYKLAVEESHEDTIILTPDVRFPNEVKCIQDLGGHVIRLLRAPFPDDKHESETALDNMDLATTRPEIAEFWHEGKLLTFDAVLDNCKMTIAEQNEAVWKLVKERNWI